MKAWIRRTAMRVQEKELTASMKNQSDLAPDQMWGTKKYENKSYSWEIKYKLSEEKCGFVYQDPFFKFLFPAIRMAKIQINDNTNCW